MFPKESAFVALFLDGETGHFTSKTGIKSFESLAWNVIVLFYDTSKAEHFVRPYFVLQGVQPYR